ncbi:MULTISPECIES: hypothetical protein [Methanothermobacter]|uniref:Uncharacterized protein n=1 Tax=Methanothermobacter marburgensis (strain ATCC BAA-927 / DSM 2133 / JCM 14651 / NBRC 100331 / OCM 82 / Marburg) TaxID=79929 RepID=D9PYD7_METTM|nr:MULTISPECIES: hypothetical protein [Methanothermobacter]ADL59235.1 conserved hypothetical protein [Methanothermobacter marburgensis str. Marburg]QEF94601.1 hypothetical protein FVF72_05220 [Methanothermobacter sp. KEPCO-1]WBF09738.1 hypothetical protein ISG34_08175 [Methanothermobacter marburgensis]
MIRIERTCASFRATVIQEGEEIGIMEGIYLTQWFLKTRYHFTGTFIRFIPSDERFNRSGLTVDIHLHDQNVIVKDALIDWLSDSGRGTFRARRIESVV